MPYPSARALVRDWRTAALVVSSVALAIAVNSTVVSLLEALIFPKMDMSAPDRLYWVDFYGDRANRLPAERRDSVLNSHATSFSSSTWRRSDDNAVVLENGDRFAAVTSVRVGPQFFNVAAITPLRGRVLSAADTNAHPAVVVLSQRAASLLFGDESPIDRQVIYQGSPRLVVGVLGNHADFPNTNAGVWSLGGPLPHARRGTQRLIRIRDGYRRHDAELALDTASREVASLVHEPASQVAFRLQPAVQTQFRYQRFHYAIVASCVALLLIACANAANLELSRALSRRREFAIRAALGGSPLALVRDVFKEQALLAALAAAMALPLTYAASIALYRMVPRNVGEFVVQPQVGWRVVAFALLAAVIATLLVGCAPAISSARADPQEALKDAAGTGRSHRHYYAFLVAVELGLAIALCGGGIVMMRATAAADAQSLGLDVRGRILGSLRQDGGASAREAMEALNRRLASVKGVASAGVFQRPFVHDHVVTVDDSTGALVQVPAPLVQYSIVTTGYLETLGVRLVLGSGFDTTIMDKPQIVLDQKSAARLWPGANPIGRRLMLGGASLSNLSFGRVVGVIADADEFSKRSVGGPRSGERTLGAIYYLPSRYDPTTATPYTFRDYGFLARADSNPASVVLAIRRELIRVDNAPLSSVELLDDALGISQVRDSRHFLMLLFSFFALCGVALTGIAVLSVVSRAVTERHRELAVRRALGARSYHVLYAVLREMVPVVLLGVALGLALTKYAIPLLGSQALADDRFNAPLFAATSVLVVSVFTALVALPAFRATRVPPADALRSL